MSDMQERRARLALIRSENVGPVTFHDLLKYYGSAKAAYDALPDLAQRGGRKRPIKRASKRDVDTEWARIEKLGATLTFFDEPDFPSLLAQAEPTPPLIITKGDLSLLSRNCVAMVGARNASVAGRRMAAELAAGLGKNNITVVSGLARGIDTACHQASLDTGTCAVIAGGIDNYYPPENQALQDAIIERGVLVSEMPPGTKPQGRHFPRRNRLISGIAAGVVVVEAALRSGSLITARYALEQNRDVMAVPGSPLDPRAKGNNDLLRQGAVFIETVDDILAALPTLNALKEQHLTQHFREEPSVTNHNTDPTNAERTAILQCLGPVPIHRDEIVQHTGLPLSIISIVLIELELSGHLYREAGGGIALIPTPANHQTEM